MNLREQIAEMADRLKEIAGQTEQWDELHRSIITKVDYLELRAATAKVGSVQDIRVGPPGAVYASEMAKQDEKNARDRNYVPSWNPGKEKSANKADKAGLEEVLKNPQLTPEVRAWLESM